MTKQKFENKTANIRKYLTTFSRTFDCGEVVRPEDACQKRFSWFLNWNPKVQKCVLRPEDVCRKSFSWFFYQIPKAQRKVDLRKYDRLISSRQELSNKYLVFTCKHRLRCSRERVPESLPKGNQTLTKQIDWVRPNIVFFLLISQGSAESDSGLPPHPALLMNW